MTRLRHRIVGDQAGIATELAGVGQPFVAATGATVVQAFVQFPHADKIAGLGNHLLFRTAGSTEGFALHHQLFVVLAGGMPFDRAIDDMHLGLVGPDVDGEFRSQIDDLAVCRANAKPMCGFRNVCAHLAVVDTHLHGGENFKKRIALDDHGHATEQLQLCHARLQTDFTGWKQVTLYQLRMTFPNRIIDTGQNTKALGAGVPPCSLRSRQPVLPATDGWRRRRFRP